MADKAISELVAAEQITATDMFVLEQNNTAKKLTGQVLLNWLTAAADGHGGISGVSKIETSGLVDTYRMNFADLTTFDFYVTNGRSISSVTQTSASGLTRTYTIAFNDGTSQTFTVTDGRSITKISKTSTSGLVDTYTITFSDGSTDSFTVTNGAKGDKGDNTYTHIKFASQEPTESSHSMGDVPDEWIGFYWGSSADAPTDWKQYKWYQIKGEKGDTGTPASLVSSSVTYQVGDSGTIIPSGSWSTSIPTVTQGKYLWTKMVQQFNTGDPVTAYSVARMGIDGLGSVVSVAGISPDDDGNVPLTAEDVDALPISGGDMEGPINMNGQPLSGLNAPTEETQAANKGYVDGAVKKAAPPNLLDNSYFILGYLVNQRGKTTYNTDFTYSIDRWMLGNGGSCLTVLTDGIKLTSTGGELLPYVFQRVESLPAGTYTYAAKFKGNTGTAVISNAPSDWGLCNAPSSSDSEGILVLNFTITEDWDANNAYFRLQNMQPTKECIWEWAALYEGEYTAETLPEYQPKGYAAELAECLRYFERINAVTSFHPFAVGVLRYATTFVGNLQYSKKRISTPTVSCSGAFRITSSAVLSVSDITFEQANDNSILVKATVASGGTAGDGAILQADNSSASYFDISADL